MKTVFKTIAAAAVVAVVVTSCSSSSKVTHHHQQHLKSKHSGSHHLNTTNRGCGWANN
jgi:predicted component of type VI protein secretion system